MKLSSFRIRERIHPKNLNLKTQNLQQNTSEQSLPTNDQLKFSSLLQSFENIIASFVNSSNSQSVKPKKTANLPQTPVHELEHRDRFVIISLPNFAQDSIELKRLQPWIGKVCEQSLSVAFNYFLDKKMNYDQMKAFASQSLLRNIVNLADHYHLEPQIFRFINQTIQEKVLPFLKAKYPLAVEKLPSKGLLSAVKSIDNSEIVTNDYFFTSDIRFEYREDGKYDDIIMALMNELMQRSDNPIFSNSSNKISNFKDFENMMTELFQKSFDQDWMDDNDHSPVLKEKKHKKQKEKYQQKVKEYTSFLIGRKISENTPIYSDDEVKSRYLSIKTPAILRILTKWCDQLWSKFSNENYFSERTDGLLLVQSKRIGLVYPWIKERLKACMIKEKQEILAFLKEIQDINYKQQVHLLQNEIEDTQNLFLDRHQRVTGKFACKVINNVESFIVDYLNRLIHGLIKVSKQCFKEMSQYKEYWPSPYHLVTFSVSDLLRCKYSSKEKQVLCIFKEIQRIANEDPEKFKIIKIKNRLRNATNDIMIIAKFNNIINCEIQIAVNNTISEFMDCSNKINHYIYELERSTFGPILELCGIWKNCERRSDMFLKLVEEQKSRRQNNRIENGECSKNGKDHELAQEKKPFICSECSKHYYHSNFIVSHQKCKSCDYWKCARCLIFENFDNENQSFFFNKDKQASEYKFWKRKDEVPVSGACIFINKPVIEVNCYKKIDYNFRTYLISRKNGEDLVILKQLKSKKQITQFFKECLVFQVSQQKVYQQLRLEQPQLLKTVISTYLIPGRLKDSFKQQKEAISILRQDHFTDVNFEKIYIQHPEKLKFIESIEFSSCSLQRLDFLTPNFINLKRINLNLNKLSDISHVCKFKRLQKVYINQNRIEEIPLEIADLKQLKQLHLYNNKIATIPQTFCHLTELTSLNLSNNQLSSVPQSFISLQKMKQLQMKANKFEQFPGPILELKNLQILNLSWNPLKKIPDGLGTLQKLTSLNLYKCQISEWNSCIFQLSELTDLKLGQNQLSLIEDKFDTLKKLETVDISKNKLTEVPSTLFNMKSLTQLLYLGRLISTIDVHWLPGPLVKNTLKISYQQQVKQITCLQMPSNQKQINRIQVIQTPIEKFPEFFFQFHNVEAIIFQKNKISSIPDLFGNQSKLKVLKLENNLIQSLPPSLARIKSLQELSLSLNQIETLPQVISELINLKILRAEENKIKSIPDSFKALQKLEKLYFKKNKLEYIPQLFGEMKALKQIYLDENQVKEIPRRLCANIEIIGLFLNKNLIELVPEEICEMKNLISLNLEKNPIKKIQNEEAFCLRFPQVHKKIPKLQNS